MATAHGNAACRFFLAGECAHGNECRFWHPQPRGSAPTGQPVYNSRALRAGSRDVVPSVPGRRLNDRDTTPLRAAVRDWLGLEKLDFPGAQPVSFTRKEVSKLMEEDYFVTEKSDGQRVLVVIVCSEATGEQLVYLADRKNDYYQVTGLKFPMHTDPLALQHGTIIDGELVMECDSQPPRTKLLAFDCLAWQGKSLVDRDLVKRLGYLNDFVVRPHRKLLERERHSPHQASFIIELKSMERAYGMGLVLEKIPTLSHKSDGLIFTAVNAPYKPGTNVKMLKWKMEQTVDFKLHIVNDPSYHIPKFCLRWWRGDSTYEDHSEMFVTEEEWERQFRPMHRKGQLEGRIVEVFFDGSLRPPWRFQRFRDDKPDGNFYKIVVKIMESIRNGIVKDELLEAVPSIRGSWKDRNGEKDTSQSARDLRRNLEVHARHNPDPIDRNGVQEVAQHSRVRSSSPSHSVRYNRGQSGNNDGYDAAWQQSGSSSRGGQERVDQNGSSTSRERNDDRDPNRAKRPRDPYDSDESGAPSSSRRRMHEPEDSKRSPSQRTEERDTNSSSASDGSLSSSRSSTPNGDEYDETNCT